jgi:hypothetical protein
MLCEEGMTTIKAKSALSVPQNIKNAAPLKTQNNTGKTNKYCTNYEMNNHNVETCKKKKGINHNGSHKSNITKSKTTKDIFICMPHLWFEWT